jgi:hypothetical protein
VKDQEFDCILKKALMDTAVLETAMAEREWAGREIKFSEDYLRKRDCLLRGQLCEETSAADGTFQEPTVQKPPRRIKRALLIAAILIAVLAIAVVSVSAQNPNWWRALITRTSETFSLGDAPAGTEIELPPPNPAASDPASPCYGIQKELNADGITTALTPTWLPNGYRIESCTRYDVYSYMQYYGIGGNDAGAFSFSCMAYYDSPDGQGTNYEREGDLPIEIYLSHGVEHYITMNCSYHVAVWRVGKYECSISANMTHDELIQTIESIYTN